MIPSSHAAAAGEDLEHKPAAEGNHQGDQGEEGSPVVDNPVEEDTAGDIEGNPAEDNLHTSNAPKVRRRLWLVGKDGRLLLPFDILIHISAARTQFSCRLVEPMME